MSTSCHRLPKQKNEGRGKVTIGYDPDGRKVYKYVTALTCRELENMKAAVREHYIGEDPRDQLFYEYAVQRYRIKKEAFISNAGHSYYKTCFGRYLLPKLGMQHTKAITAVQIQKFIINGFARASKSRIHNVIGPLKATFASVYGWGHAQDSRRGPLYPRPGSSAGDTASKAEATRPTAWGNGTNAFGCADPTARAESFISLHIDRGKRCFPGISLIGGRWEALLCLHVQCREVFSYNMLLTLCRFLSGCYKHHEKLMPFL